MIVRPDGTYESNSLFLNSNWYENETENYVVDETTEVGQTLSVKIVSLYPFYNLIIEQGVLVDVETRDPLPGEIVDPSPPPKTPEELRIEQLESDNLMLMEAFANLYEMILAGGDAV
ncbi:hypothetical protein EV294_11255 [Paenibacillus sp. BK033]|uniref:hypothetical protein n=1 Tax=Paenibacillus sp. BK033 TaxID=2512133 RepID=UPI0010463E2B|nr:hypothetical protein [Paenibacillus sp. BK033]TCM89590.1 hypothetical protein EV294_11255 [Paenibacillus sp. BK033]